MVAMILLREFDGAASLKVFEKRLREIGLVSYYLKPSMLKDCDRVQMNRTEISLVE